MTPPTSGPILMSGAMVRATRNLICRLCRGTGSLFCMQGKPEFYQCPACGGAGARVMYGPKVIEVKRWHSHPVNIDQFETRKDAQR